MKWVPVMAIALLAMSCQWSAPVAALPAPEAPADSAEQIAGRLYGHLAESPASADSRARALDVPLAPECYTKQGTDRQVPPQGVPAYTAELRVAQVATPINVRIWLASAEEAARLTGTVRQAAAICRPVAARPFTRAGWDGVELAVTRPTSSDNGDPVTFATVVAHRGGLLAEVSWWWLADDYGDLDRARLEQGVGAAGAVLAAVGGDPARAAPERPSPDAPVSALAAALPPISEYGPGLAVWPDAEALRTENAERARQAYDLLCSYAAYEPGAAGGVPRVQRRLFGSITLWEEVLVLPDEQAAEQVRRRMVRKLDNGDKDTFLPCSWWEDHSDGPYIRIPRTIEPFGHGGWTGETESLGVRKRRLPPQATYRDSAAQIAIAVRRGTTVVHLRWQGPAGADLRGALDRGRAELIHTLDALPTP
ncbi:hypothetical protein GCM10009555_068890 [Acrocarpospora macrocephala]|uniref:Uncharacterized protein n=2 Tax=Acrocarpospora macrocephala TaxID=150177 RepID=A0A5M3X2R8_9ACTN|nr:hypothetical protein Amac_096330 [Acrocarpospora macrocephala]